MSEKVSIQESGKSRNFSGVETIETETPEGESCFWVPESERELETEYVIKNGTYRPQKYGFSDIHVNVFDLTTDLDGNDWKIDIGDIDVPDVPMPDISLPDFDIDLSLDIDDIGDMPSIDLTIDGVKLDLPDLSETIDLDAGFDVSLDVGDMSMGIDDMSLDLIGVDLNGDDIKVDIDLGDMSIDVESCPESIYILSRPASLVYTEGDTIDFSGLVVAALDKDGMDWPDPSTFTEIPLSELIIPSGIKAVYDDQHSDVIVNTNSGDVTVSCAGPEDMVNAWITPPLLIKEGSAQLYMWIPPELPEHYQFIIIGENTVVTGQKHEDETWTVVGGLGNSRANQSVGWPWAANTIPPPPEITDGNWRDNIKECIQTITVGWTGPCMQYFETSFDIYVRKNDTDASGGGTTISGNYGGSHHSGKF